MKAWIAKRPVVAYYLLTLVLSWGYWITLIAQGKQVTPGSSTSHLPGLMGPALAAIVITMAIDGGSGLRELSSRIVRLRPAWPWGILAALSPLPVAVVIFAAMTTSGEPLPPLQDFLTYPGLPATMSAGATLLGVLILNGYGEEIGWRGFVMEKWLPRYGRFGTTIRLAGLWLFWHAPVFLLNQTMAALIGPMLLGWAFGLTCGAFVLAQIYLFSGRSILVLALWHATYNMTVATPATTGFPAAAISTAVMVWGVIVAWKWWREDRAHGISSA